MVIQDECQTEEDQGNPETDAFASDDRILLRVHTSYHC